MGVIQERVARNQRVLVTTLTKRMAEGLTDYLTEGGIKAEYLHSDVDTLDRARILKGTTPRCFRRACRDKPPP